MSSVSALTARGFYVFIKSATIKKSNNYKKLHNHRHHQSGLQRSLVTPMRALASHLEVHRASIPNHKTEAQPPRHKKTIETPAFEIMSKRKAKKTF